MQMILWGGGLACACEHMLDYTNNPENILTLILHSFIRSFSNFRSCQIRPIFPILLFWSKFKHACKCVKFALQYQIIKLEGFFSTLFKMLLFKANSETYSQYQCTLFRALNFFKLCKPFQTF